MRSLPHVSPARPRHALLFAALLFACGSSERASSEPPDPALPPEAAAARLPLIEAIATPAVLDEAGERALAEAVGRSFPLDMIPAAPAREQVTVSADAGRMNRENVAALRALLAQASAADDATSTSSRPLETPLPSVRGEPWVVLRPDGHVEVHYLAAAQAAANVTFGAVVPADPLGLPRYRQRSLAAQDVAPGHRFVVFDLQSVLAPRYDVAEVVRRGRGSAPWRLEVVDAAAATTRVFDGRIDYRCAPCVAEEGEEPPRYTRLPALRLGPFVDQVGPGGAIISFDADVPVAAAVVVFAEGREGRTYRSEQVGPHHEIVLEDLEPGTRYRYQPVLLDHAGEIGIDRGGTFETEQDGLDTFEFVVLSDSRSGHGSADEHYGGTNARVLRGLLLQAMQSDPRLVLFVGDLIDGYTTHAEVFQEELDAWKRAVQPFHAHLPIYEVMGNHEALVDLWSGGPGGRHLAAARQEPESAESLFGAAFVNPGNGPASDGPLPYAENTYSFDFGNAHFAVVNTNYNYRSHPDYAEHPGASRGGQREGWIDDTSISWLDGDLAAARAAGARHLFVFTHEPGFPNGGHVQDGIYWNGDPEVLAQRAALYEVLGRHRVAAIFHGDEHNYSRTRIDRASLPELAHPLWQIISGGAGAPYYTQDRSVPWVDQVRAFDPRQHFVRVQIEGDRATAEAVSLTGEIIDRFELGSSEPGEARGVE